MNAAPTMRDLVDAIDPRERIDLDVPLEHIEANQLIDIVRQIDALSDRVEDAIFDRLRDEPIAEADGGRPGVSPETVAQRSQRDARRRDQLVQLGKKQAAVRASMGT
jgi:hypothetical protein